MHNDPPSEIGKKDATLEVEPGPESRPGRDCGAIGERWRSGWRRVFGGCPIAHDPGLRLPAPSTLPAGRGGGNRANISARASGTPPAEVSHDDRSHGTHAHLPADTFSSTVQLGAPTRRERLPFLAFPVGLRRDACRHLCRTRSCSYAEAVAAAREVRPSFVKMWLT